MLPSEHILLGLMFSALILFFFPSMGAFGFLIIFLSSFVFDADHYLAYIAITKDWSLNKAFEFFITTTDDAKKSNKKQQGPLTIFHTIEFILLLGALSFFHVFFLYVLLGLIFHSVLDIYFLYKEKILFMRDFSVILYLKRKRKK